MNDSYDLKHRILRFNKREIHLYFLASLIHDELISRIVEGIEHNKGKDLMNCINAGDVVKYGYGQEKDVEYLLLSGNLVIYDRDVIYVIDAKKFPNRSIQQPDTEKSVRGAKDGFNESLLNNTGLIRRRMKCSDLCFHLEKIGTENPCDIAVVYLQNSVNQKLLDDVIQRIKAIRTKNLIMSDRALEELLLDQGYNPFPLVRYSERPDIVASHIQHGHIAIIVDTSSSVLMLPVNLFDILEYVEEHRQTPIIGTFIRLIRLIACFLSVYLMPIYSLVFSYKQWDYDFFIQILIVEFAIELLRIATIHTPDSISNAMGLIAALLLGEYAVELGFFTKDILLFSSISSICNFATPNYELSLTNKYVRIFMIVSIMFLNIYGFVLYNFILVVYLMSLKPFHCSYLYPLYPLDLKKLYQYLIRKPKNN